MARLRQTLTTQDLVDMFCVCRATIYNWRDKGLPFYHLNGDGIKDPVRYKRDQVLDWAKTHDKDVVNDIYITW